MSLSTQWDALVRLGPLSESLADPIIPCKPHPFDLIEGNHLCGQCGAGILNPIHEPYVFDGDDGRPLFKETP
jgi:hypothetical protein